MKKILESIGIVGIVILCILGLLVLFIVISLIYHSVTNPYIYFSSYDVLPGEKIFLKEEIDFYFEKDSDSYKSIDPNKEVEIKTGKKSTLKEIMLDKASVTAPYNIKVNTQSLNIVQKIIEISFTFFSNESSEEHITKFKGLRLIVNASISTDSALSPGVYKVNISTPGIEMIRKLTETDVAFASNQSLSIVPRIGKYFPAIHFYNSKQATIYPITIIHVHSNNFTKYSSMFAHWLIRGRAGRVTLTAILIAIVICLFVLSNKLRERRKRKMAKIFSPLLNSVTISPIINIPSQIPIPYKDKSDLPKIVAGKEHSPVLYGKILVVDSKRQIDDLHLRLPKLIRAEKPSEVGAIVVLDHAEANVCEYTSKSQGFVLWCFGRIIILPSNNIATFCAVGSFPPSSTEDTSKKIYGASPNKQVIDYLLSLQKK